MFFRTSFYVSRGRFWGKNTFWKWWFYCNFSALSEQIWSFEGKFLWRLTNNLLYGFRNRNLGIQRYKLRSFFLGKVMVFQSSQYFDQNIFGFWEKTFAKGCQNCIRRVQMKVLRIFFEKKLWFSVIFAPWAENFRTFAKHLRQGFQNINLSVQGIFFRKTFKKLINF